ncbi:MULTISPECIES: type II toxin-antitoxin system PemK/MazF family toxin [Bacillaceae]|uniref:Type II toxin-antitoxin system PemK/MazF family toxin n=1 Tax=Niallia hominis TaxID=3133173 RepID=A0ABV1EVW3_9BACI|nr:MULTISPECIES: type II toxin-antitoxin system PemK/MazF family toxin [Bacillaceae]MCF2646433.1 type II toxin-antitoxin system PemK/MazF family toxin [Niallia circulans]MCM3361665.1 type II toxin-antitoxin system PemK/MazF family toxin [Niallia sp. MER TA 168]CAI9395409.1 hypothetical protein BACSP_04073 [Bacillus sp. T2.9-1]
MPWNKNENIRQSAEWLSEKYKLMDDKEKMLNSHASKPKVRGKKPPIRDVFRGGVYWVNFGKGNLGAEKNKTRPAVIVSPNHLNTGETVVVIPISTKFPYSVAHGKKIPKYKNHFFLYKNKYKELEELSAIKCEDIKTIDISRIGDLIFNIEKKDMKLLKSRLMYMFGY